MKKKNLFQAVKTFINNTPKGETFTTKELIASVGNQEEPSSWKKWNNNPYYRTHTYKSYLKRTGFLSNPKYGVWEVKKHIPDFINLGTIEFLIGYKNYRNKYNGLTEQQIKDKIVGFNKLFKCTCSEGNRCIVCFIPDGETTQQFLGSIGMEDQMLRQLIMSQPIDEIKYLLEEREDLEKVRILDEIKKEKVMKFDFEKGKQGLIEYFEMEFERASMYSLEYIKECDDMDDVKSEVRSFNAFEEVHFKLRAKIDRASTLSLVFEALVDTCLEDDDETILSFFIEGLQ
jgi:hypothetical protein